MDTAGSKTSIQWAMGLEWFSHLYGKDERRTEFLPFLTFSMAKDDTQNVSALMKKDFNLFTWISPLSSLILYTKYFHASSITFFKQPDANC